MVLFLNIRISGLARIFFLNLSIYLLPQGLLCQITSRYCLYCVAPHVSASYQIPECQTTLFVFKKVRDQASKWSNACFSSELPSIKLDGDRSIVNGNYVSIANTDQEISVPSTGPAFQAYSANNTPCNHWWKLPLSAEFIFCTLLN